MAMVVFIVALIITSGSTSALTNYNNLIDDSIFTNSNSMNASSIDSFLNSFPNSCISTNNGFSAPDLIGYNPTDKFIYGADTSAGNIIYHAAQAYGINPQVILTTLQKEQGLVVGDGPDIVRNGTDCGPLAISKSMGYNCPDGGANYSYSGFEMYSHNGNPISSVSGTCVKRSSYVGFSRQIIIASWQYTLDMHRAEGQNNWYSNKPNWNNIDDLNGCYSQRTISGGPMYLCPDNVGHKNDPYVSHSGQYVIDGTVVFIFNGPTAALYNYTPHLHGQILFTSIFNKWFGPTAALYSINTIPISSVTNMVGRTATIGFTTTYKPAWPVVLNLSNSNENEGTMTSNTVTIQPENWNDPSKNSITVYAHEDGIDQGPVRYNISISNVGSLDPAFNNLNTDYLKTASILNMANGDQSVYRLFNPSKGLHYFTAVKSERDNALANGYISEGTGFYYCKNDSFDVIRLTNESNGSNMLTSSIPEINSASVNSLASSVAFSTSLNGDVPVYRLFNASTKDYFYTTSLSEKNNAVSINGYADQGISFFSCPSNYQPVYRMYRASTGSHFYTTDFNERLNAGNYGFNYDTVAFYVTPNNNGTPVFRLYRASTGSHFYTSNSAERDAALTVGYKYEKIAFVL